MNVIPQTLDRAAIQRTVNALAEGLRRNASDVHFTPGARVKIRVEGDLEDLECDNQPWEAASILHSWTWITSEPELPKPGYFRIPDDRTVKVVNLPDLPPVRLRLHAKLVQGMVGYNVRYQPERPRTLEELGLPDHFIRLCETRSSGIILVCGATGAGKSTTSYGIVDHLLTTQKIKADTFESPIEVLLSNEGKLGLIQQHEIPSDIPDYHTAQFSSLRDDPDLVLYSELRSDEAIRKAVEEANTGHLVFGTLHTGTAAQSLMRIMAAKPATSESSYLQDVAHCLVAVLCQRLVKGPNGKRLPNYEILIVNEAVAGVIMRGDFKQLDNAISAGGGSGMMSFDEHLFKLVESKQLTVETALKASPLPRATLSYFVEKRIIGRADEEKLKTIYVV